MLRYLRNLVAYSIYKFLGLFYSKRNTGGKSLLFINTGNVGDVIISTVILDYENNFDDYDHVYLLIKDNLAEALSGYKGNINIIKWDYGKYKWNIKFRFSFLKYLHSLRLKNCYNLTFARGITSDEIALLSGSGEIVSLSSNREYLGNNFGTRMDRKYDNLMFCDIENEYDKHKQVIKKIAGPDNVNVVNSKSGLVGSIDIPRAVSDFIADDEYIIVAPCASMSVKEYGLNNYKTMCRELSDHYKIILIGSPDESSKLKFVMGETKNVLNAGTILNLGHILQLISRCSLYIGNDSGFSHMALRLDAPMIALIGGGYYNKYFPYEESGTRKYFYHKIECFGCQWKCIQPEPYCLTKVDLRDVLDEANKILSSIKSNTNFRNPLA